MRSGSAIGAGAILFAMSALGPSVFAQTVTATALPLTKCGVSSTNVSGVMTTMQWTGACVDGFADGPGVLAVTAHSESSGFVMDAQSRVEKTYRRGYQVGLLCWVTSEIVLNKVKQPDLSGRCRVVDGVRSTSDYRRAPSGSWIKSSPLIIAATAADDAPIVAPAGALEALSAAVLADYDAGRKPEFRLPVSSSILAEFVGGGRITSQPAEGPLDLKHKRVALILSGGTISEFDRFRRESQAFLTATAGQDSRPGSHRNVFMAQASPDRLLARWTDGLAGQVGALVAADDLGVLASGKADYAIIVDWRFKARFDVSGATYAKLPVCKAAGETERKTCEPVYADSLQTFLIGPGPTLLSTGDETHSYKGQPARGKDDQMHMFRVATDGWGRASAFTGSAAFFMLSPELQWVPKP